MPAKDIRATKHPQPSKIGNMTFPDKAPTRPIIIAKLTAIVL